MHRGEDDIERLLSRTGTEDETSSVSQPPALRPIPAPATRSSSTSTRVPAPATRTTISDTSAPGSSRNIASASRSSGPNRTPVSDSRPSGLNRIPYPASRPTNLDKVPNPAHGTPRLRPGTVFPPPGYKLDQQFSLRKYCVPITASLLILASIVVISILIKVVLDNSYFFCLKSFKFISVDKWCDGIADCIGNEDELRCVQSATVSTSPIVRISDVGSILQIYIASLNTWSLVCFDTWDMNRAKAACAQLGYYSTPLFSSVSIKDLDNPQPTTFSNVLVLSDNNIQPIPIGGMNCLSRQVVSLTCSVCGSKNSQTRVIGGSAATIKKWPWQASMQYMGQHVCGGSIINPNWVLTAAHCIIPPQRQVDRWRVQVGVTTLTFMFASPADKIFIHSQYIQGKYPYDIALFKLKTSLTFSETMQPVCLPGFNAKIPDGAILWVTGWGYTVESGKVLAPQLQEVSINLIPNTVCNQQYANQILDSMLCAGSLSGGLDTCKGDSGGALVSSLSSPHWEQVGIVSWGDGCGLAGKVGVYTSVQAYLDWIHEVMKRES